MGWEKINFPVHNKNNVIVKHVPTYCRFKDADYFSKTTIDAFDKEGNYLGPWEQQGNFKTEHCDEQWFVKNFKITLTDDGEYQTSNSFRHNLEIIFVDLEMYFFIYHDHDLVVDACDAYNIFMLASKLIGFQALSTIPNFRQRNKDHLFYEVVVINQKSGYYYKTLDQGLALEKGIIKNQNCYDQTFYLNKDIFPKLDTATPYQKNQFLIKVLERRTIKSKDSQPRFIPIDL